MIGPEPRERPCAAIPLPAEMAAAVAGYAWTRDAVGESGSAVYRLCAPGDAPSLYLKHGRAEIAADIVDEMARLRWLAGHAPVPRVRTFAAGPDEAWLLTTAVPGRAAYAELVAADPGARGAIVAALARALRRWHAIPVERCPFAADSGVRLARARDRIDAGLVDTADFDEARAGWTAEQVWDAMIALLPLATTDAVVTHGDFSLDNVLLRDGEVTGCIDVGRAGIADRYQDLAIMWNCLGEFDLALRTDFLAAYGIAVPDPGRLTFHLMLDEFF